MSPIEVDSNYIVQSGDSLSAIAERAYNGSSEAGWRRIYDVNKGVIGNDPNLIRPGQVLYIPVLTTGSSSPGSDYTVSSSPIKVGSDYTVHRGEGLSAIAKRAYNDSSAWPNIYHANRQVIGNDPNLTRIGQVLHIPPLEADTKYIVKEHDTLSAIAQKKYNDSSEAAWKRIYDANKGVIGNDFGHDPDVIRPGQVLHIPPKTGN